MKNAEDLLQDALRNGDSSAFEQVYLSNKKAFLKFGMHYEISGDQLLDIYQEAVIALFQNFVERQLILDSSTVKTYLFGIGKQMIYKALKADRKLFRIDDVNDAIPGVTIELPDNSERTQQLARAFAKLGAKCQEVIRLFYYRGLSIKEIVTSTGYKDENTVKSQKSRCMKQLKALTQEER